MPASRSTRTEKLDLRLSSAAKQALRAAAAAAQRSISDFVLESALARADETLAERQRFGLDAKQWQKFMAALDAPVRTLPRAERLLNEPGVFDSK
ncbi:MAG TPA: DUF1778 domain-containing protein [Polyangiales bacterium]|jgi:uncharacterized protein (DUF1778 family)|nr:DUF1778 domain-containing protein [Polyangiales bacterium]